jgi:hypothetical protein
MGELPLGREDALSTRSIHFFATTLRSLMARGDCTSILVPNMHDKSP